ncbi:MAG TPA: sugar phosphate isomerase/epimerase [Planctomycetes bacterium]|nr:sugar phosphate isomerase/epimerase [Planctomycetota bacterium]
MFVAASTNCFPDLPLDSALERLVDLEYTAVEIVIHETGGCLKPSEVARDWDRVVRRCRQTYRMTVAAYSVDIEAEGPEYFGQLAACCRLAKATRVVTMVVRASELGTPFNAEVERLREMVRIATGEGVRLALLTETGRMSEDPDTVVVLCDNVHGLGVTLDPSHFIYGGRGGKGYRQLLKYVCHVRLRDTTPEKLQVRVGQGRVEYGKLLAQLERVGYHRALCVDITPMDGVDHGGELRKMRLLLESLL